MILSLRPHKGLQGVHDSSGHRVTTIEVDTGMQQIMLRGDDGRDTQIGFLHPNHFVHFVIPEPPESLKAAVKEFVEAQTAKPVLKIGTAPSPTVEDDLESE